MAADVGALTTTLGRYLDPNVDPDPDALGKPDSASSYCLGQFLLGILFVLFVFAVVAMIGFYFYLQHLPG
jgi:hypothetical protein